MLSVPITTKVVSSNPVNGEVYSIQHYVIKFASDLVGGFLQVLRFLPPIKLPPWYSWNIAESGVKHHNHNSNPNLITRKRLINILLSFNPHVNKKNDQCLFPPFTFLYMWTLKYVENVNMLHVVYISNRIMLICIC